MRASLQRLAVLAVALGYVAVAGVGSSETRAEEVVYTKNARQVLSELKSTPAGEALGELAQQVFRDSVGSLTTAFPVVESQVFNQDMTIAGNGNHRGYEILIFKTGDRAFSTYLISDIPQQAHAASRRGRNMGSPRQEVNHGDEQGAVSTRTFDG